MLSDLLFRARALLRRREVDADLDEELRAHLDAQTPKARAVGFSRDEARAAARTSSSAASNRSAPTAATHAA